MTCDPNALQWITAVGTLLAIAYAARSSRAAGRSARAAEQNVELQTRPLLIDVPLEPYTDYEHPYRRPTGERVKASWRGEITANVEERWISVPVRNVGRGTALVADVELLVGEAKPRRMTFPTSEVTSQETVPPGEETRLGFIVREEDAADRPEFIDALGIGRGLQVIVDYTDIGGHQRQRATLTLGREAGQPWRVSRVLHKAR